ncbi:MAG: hypothetical protein F4Z07_05060 [Dehalococcoidia bacterium]|nr:hypothetical protein [Dehalococcoidia bacterium]
MRLITFPQALAVTAVVNLTLFLTLCGPAAAWMTIAEALEDGPSTAGPILVGVGALALALGTLAVAGWMMRSGKHKAGFTFGQLLVVAGLLGLGMATALSPNTVTLIASFEWADGYNLAPLDESNRLTHALARGIFDAQTPDHVYFGRLNSYTPGLVALAVSFAVPLVVLLEGLRRTPVHGREDIRNVQVVACLALLALMLAIATAPYAISAAKAEAYFGWKARLNDLIPLGIGLAVPVAVLAFLLVRRNHLNAASDSPGQLVSVALLGLGSVATASLYGPLLVAVAGIPLVALLWSVLNGGISDEGAQHPFNTGQLLAGVALIGLAMCGAATPWAIAVFEWRRAFLLTETWLIATLAAAYAINLGVLAAAVWRLRVESRREQAPEPENA